MMPISPAFACLIESAVPTALLAESCRDTPNSLQGKVRTLNSCHLFRGEADPSVEDDPALEVLRHTVRWRQAGMGAATGEAGWEGEWSSLLH